jgi:hypothetical protein
MSLLFFYYETIRSLIPELMYVHYCFIDKQQSCSEQNRHYTFQVQ